MKSIRTHKKTCKKAEIHSLWLILPSTPISYLRFVNGEKYSCRELDQRLWSAEHSQVQMLWTVIFVLTTVQLHNLKHKHYICLLVRMLPKSINIYGTRKAQILSYLNCALTFCSRRARLDVLFAQELDLTSSTAPHCSVFGRTTVHSEPTVNLFLMILRAKLQNMGFL